MYRSVHSYGNSVSEWKTILKQEVYNWSLWTKNNKNYKLSNSQAALSTIIMWSTLQLGNKSLPCDVWIILFIWKMILANNQSTLQGLYSLDTKNLSLSYFSLALHACIHTLKTINWKKQSHPRHKLKIARVVAFYKAMLEGEQLSFLWSYFYHLEELPTSRVITG